MPTLRIPLVGSITNRNMNPESFATKDQQFVNVYPEVTKNPVTGKGAAALYKRPGYAAGGALAGVSTACTAGAFVAWTGSGNSTPPPVTAFLVNGSTSTSVWRLDNESKLGGDIPTTNECTALTETMLSGTPFLVGNFIDSGSGAVERWVYPEGGAWAQVTTNFPSTLVGFPAHMDGYTFDMTSDGFLVNSDLNASTYSVLGKIGANAHPDKGVTAARHGNMIFAFGEKSIERFTNTGNPVGSPLSRVQDGGINMGAARRSASGPQTVLPAHGTLYWMGTNSEGAVTGVYRWGSGPEKVSTPAIDKLLMATGLAGFVGTHVSHGMRHVLMRGSSGCWAYCVDTNYWWKLELASGEMRGAMGVGVLITPPHGRTYFTGTNNARGNSMGGGTTAVNQDDAVNFTATVQSQNIDFGTRRKKIWTGLSVIGDVQTSTCNVQVSTSDDDYTTSSVARSIDMSSASANRLTRWGASRRRSWKFTNSSDTPLRIEAVEFEYELGGP